MGWEPEPQRRWEHYYLCGWGLDPDLMRERLDMLRWEQERRMHQHYDDVDESLFYARTRHVVSWDCQCSSCVRKTTINMQDASFLRSIGVMWRVPNGQQGRAQDGRDADAKTAEAKGNPGL